MKNRIILLLMALFTITSAHASTETEVYRGENIAEWVKDDKLIPPMGTCRIMLFRHGETEWNVLGLPQGWSDIPLNEEGKRQSELIADNLSDISISAIYSSPLMRAVETANTIGEKHPGCEMYFDPALRFYEKNDEIAKLPKLERKKAIGKEIQRQANLYLKDLSVYHSGQNIIIITHGKVIKNIIKMINPDEQRKVKIGNTAMVSIIATEERLTLESNP